MSSRGGKSKRLVAALVHGLFGDPVRDVDDKLQRAMKTLSHRVADAEFHRSMANFYTERVLSIDPHAGPAEAWEFAEAKQKQYDHQLDCVHEEKRIEEARAVVEARKAELKKLRENGNG